HGSPFGILTRHHQRERLRRSRPRQERRKAAVYHSSYGCPFLCGFCAVASVYKGRWMGFDPDPASAGFCSPRRFILVACNGKIDTSSSPVAAVYEGVNELLGSIFSSLHHRREAQAR